MSAEWIQCAEVRSDEGFWGTTEWTAWARQVADLVEEHDACYVLGTSSDMDVFVLDALERTRSLLEDGLYLKLRHRDLRTVSVWRKADP